MMGVGMKMKKVVIFSLTRCYRLICNHLFLVGFLLLLVNLYRLFPFVFSMLVSASPVLVCTLALLGALLNFGKPNIPEIELDDRKTHELMLLKAAFLDGGIVDVEGKSTERTSEVVNDTSKVSLDGSFGRSVDKISGDKGWDDMEERLADRRVGDIQFSLISEDEIDDDEHLESENDYESSVFSFGSTEINVDILDSFPGSPWKYGDEEEGYEDDGEAMILGYDRAESSPPDDESMADITPIIDELHPLLDEDDSQPANSSLDGSYAFSEISLTSSDSTSLLDDDIDERQKLLDTEDDDEDGDDDEELNEDNEDQITWTEEDQKNLMDFRTSELERNQRLENLIVMRRAQRSLSMVTGKNLIDLDRADTPFNVPPVSTLRTNPLSRDSYEKTGFHPIPGSAPCVILPGKHPFDILYESTEEKTDLMEGSSQQEVMPLLPKDPLFSLNFTPSTFGINSPEKQVMTRFSPDIVSERLGSEGPSYSPIRRQSSEVSSDGTEEEASVIDAEHEIETPLTDDLALKEPENDSISSAAFDPQVDPELDSSAIMCLVILWLLQNPEQKSVKENLTHEELKHFLKDDEESFERSVVDECAAVLNDGVTNEDKSAMNSPNEVDTSRDVESDRGAFDVKETMQYAPGNTGFDIKTSDAVMWVNEMLVIRKKHQ